MKAIEQYFQVVLFIMFYKVVLTLKWVEKRIVCSHLNGSFLAALSCGVVYLSFYPRGLLRNFVKFAQFDFYITELAVFELLQNVMQTDMI